MYVFGGASILRLSQSHEMFHAIDPRRIHEEAFYFSIHLSIRGSFIVVVTFRGQIKDHKGVALGFGSGRC